jgi:hypothetical protein
MLNRTVVTPSLPGVTWAAWRKRLLTGPDGWLMQLVILFTIICLLACVYLWQSSAISEIQQDSARTEAASTELERTNVGLMIQVASWNSPEYIEAKARQAALKAGGAPLTLVVPLAAPPARQQDPALAEIERRWQQLISRLPRPTAAAQTTAQTRR